MSGWPAGVWHRIRGGFRQRRDFRAGFRLAVPIPDKTGALREPGAAANRKPRGTAWPSPLAGISTQLADGVEAQPVKWISQAAVAYRIAGRKLRRAMRAAVAHAHTACAATVAQQNQLLAQTGDADGFARLQFRAVKDRISTDWNEGVGSHGSSFVAAAPGEITRRSPLRCRDGFRCLARSALILSFIRYAVIQVKHTL